MRLVINICFCMLVTLTYAQEKKKTVIKKTERIEKIINDKGDTTINREIDEVIDGDVPKDMSFHQAEKMMLEGKKDGEYMTMSKEIKDGKESTIYTLTSINKGNMEVIKWDGEGEMPAKLKDKMKDVNINENRNGNKTTITIDTDGKSSIKGDEKTVIIKKGDERSDRIKLGVMINDTREGVKIDDIIKDSYADRAGLKVGDIIVKLASTYILSSDLIYDALSEIKKGDKKEILVLREGKEKTIQIQF